MSRQPPAPLRDPAEVTSVVEHVLDRLRARGHRITTPRRAIIGALARSGAHPTVEQISADVEARTPGLHLSTIYRTLETLAELGFVTHVHLGHGTTVYHLTGAKSDEGHVHAQCRLCGLVVDFPHDLLDPVRQQLDAISGFSLEPHHVALSGTCVDCRSLTDPVAPQQSPPRVAHDSQLSQAPRFS